MVFDLLGQVHNKRSPGSALRQEAARRGCSADKTVRVWNYLDMSLELEKTFVEEAFILVPGGLHVLVGFADKLRLYNLLVNDVSACRSLPSRRAASAFSNGGQLFAAVNGSVIWATTLLRGERGQLLADTAEN